MGFGGDVDVTAFVPLALASEQVRVDNKPAIAIAKTGAATSSCEKLSATETAIKSAQTLVSTSVHPEKQGVLYESSRTIHRKMVGHLPEQGAGNQWNSATFKSSAFTGKPTPR